MHLMQKIKRTCSLYRETKWRRDDFGLTRKPHKSIFHISFHFHNSIHFLQKNQYPRPNHNSTPLFSTETCPTSRRHISLQRHLPAHHQHPQSPQSPASQRQKGHNPRRRRPTPPLPLPTSRRNHNPQKQIPRQPLLRHPSLGQPSPRMGRPRSHHPPHKNLPRLTPGSVPPFQLRVSEFRSVGDCKGVGEGEGDRGCGFGERVLDLYVEAHEGREEEFGSRAG